MDQSWFFVSLAIAGLQCCCDVFPSFALLFLCISLHFVVLDDLLSLFGMPFSPRSSNISSHVFFFQKT